MRLSIYDDPQLKSLRYKPGDHLSLNKTFTIELPDGKTVTIQPPEHVVIESYAVLDDQTLGYSVSIPSTLPKRLHKTQENVVKWLLRNDTVLEYFTKVDSTLIRASYIDWE